MQNPVNLVVMACLCVVISMAMPCWSDPLPASGEIASRPTRPKVFTSPDQLRTYLQELGNYYAIEGRPRFGKRLATPAFRPSNSVLGLPGSSGAAPSSYYTPRYPAQSGVRNDLYQLLFPYDE
ncbi:pro-neuropeptide Y-like [Periplaneta americana]|uniref:pro-neuropeptide Y-like n=1 Tax=Periplaneta americana TaxID=6978 RepID=UPI0037E838D7